MITIYENLKVYRNVVPDALSGESDAMKKAAFRQRLGWQYRVAHEMLKDRITRHELTLDRIKRGAEFVPPNKVTESDYLELRSTQAETIILLMRAASTQCTETLPDALSRVKHGRDSELPNLKEETSSLEWIYRQSVEHEKKVHGLLLPEAYRNEHELLKSWTDPIRSGVGQFLGLLDFLASIRRKVIKTLAQSVQQHTIAFEAHPNIAKFTERLVSMSGESGVT